MGTNDGHGDRGGRPTRRAPRLAGVRRPQPSLAGAARSPRGPPSSPSAAFARAGPCPSGQRPAQASPSGRSRFVALLKSRLNQLSGPSRAAESSSSRKPGQGPWRVWLFTVPSVQPRILAVLLRAEVPPSAAARRLPRILAGQARPEGAARNGPRPSIPSGNASRAVPPGRPPAGSGRSGWRRDGALPRPSAAGADLVKCGPFREDAPGRSGPACRPGRTARPGPP